MITKNTRFCLVINNNITKYNIRQKDTGLGVNSSIETYKAKGYLPLEDNVPTINTATHRIAGSTYTIETDKVVKVYEIVEIPIEEIVAKAKDSMEQAIQTHINITVTSKGYDNENSIAKYLVQENPFYDECKAISLWIGSVWVKAFGIQQDVESGIRTMPTVEEVIVELPILDII